MKNKKLKFIRAVRLLAPEDKLVLQFAECVREECLPTYPGAAALEFVAAMQGLLGKTACPRRVRGHWPHPQRKPASKHTRDSSW